jgi:hypothetical protein
VKIFHTAAARRALTLGATYQENNFEFASKFFFYLMLVTVSTAAVHGQNLPDSVRPADYPFARHNAIGGAHTGIDGDLSSIFVNPAALATAKPKKTFAKLSVDIDNIGLIYNLFVAETLPDPASIFSNRFHTGMNIGGPIGLGVVNKNYGLGLFNITRVSVDWTRDDYAFISPILTEEIILAGGYGLRLYDGPRARFDLGLTGKIFARMGYNSPPVSLMGIKYILQNLAEQTFEAQIGGGIDAGFRWTLANSLSFAAVIYDPYSPVWVTRYSRAEKVKDNEITASGVIPVIPRVSFGVSWSVNPEYLNHIFSGITLSCDYADLWDYLFETSRDPLLNIGAGIEITMHEVFSIRGGWREMQPAFGIGVDFTYMNIDISFYGRELGDKPNQYSTWAGAIDISFTK